MRQELTAARRDKDEAVAGQLKAFAEHFEEMSSKLAATANTTPGKMKKGSA